jgi:hypothetical protein
MSYTTYAVDTVKSVYGSYLKSPYDQTVGRIVPNVVNDNATKTADIAISVSKYTENLIGPGINITKK